MHSDIVSGLKTGSCPLRTGELKSHSLSDSPSSPGLCNKVRAVTQGQRLCRLTYSNVLLFHLEYSDFSSLSAEKSVCEII